MSENTTTKTVTYKSVLGTVPLNLYTDPHPGMAASDRVVADCDRCGGTGRVVFKWVDGGRCWGCFGTGKTTISVATARKWAKGEAFVAEYNAEIKAYWAEFEAAQEAAANFSIAWDEAHAENARLARMARMNQGTVGEIDERVRNLVAVIEVVSSFEKPRFNGFGTELHRLVTAKLEDGRVIKMVGTAEALWSVAKGDKVSITGTVKRHAVYEKTGQMQTVLQRPAIKVLEAAE
jgi:hypothetical protein